MVQVELSGRLYDVSDITKITWQTPEGRWMEIYEDEIGSQENCTDGYTEADQFFIETADGEHHIVEQMDMDLDLICTL